MKILINKQTNKIVNFGTDNIIPSSEEELIGRNINLSAWKGSKIIYNSLRKTFEKTEGFQTWNNNTRIEHPATDLIGYNIESNRIEFYIQELDKWLYLWSEFIAITEIPTSPYFAEDFESGWFINNIFNQLFTEDLEIDWFISNNFSQLFTEQFETGGW